MITIFSRKWVSTISKLVWKILKKSFFSEFEKEFYARHGHVPGEISPSDVENVLSNLCSLDQCLKKIRCQQTQKPDEPEIGGGETFTIDDLNTETVGTKDELVIKHENNYADNECSDNQDSFPTSL